jgi:hypothetical protein
LRLPYADQVRTSCFVSLNVFFARRTFPSITPRSGSRFTERPGLGGRGGRQRQWQSLRELVRRREEEGEEGGGGGGEGGATTSGGIREAEEERIRLAVLEGSTGAALHIITSSGMLDGNATI